MESAQTQLGCTSVITSSTLHVPLEKDTEWEKIFMEQDASLRTQSRSKFKEILSLNSWGEIVFEYKIKYFQMKHTQNLHSSSLL